MLLKRPHGQSRKVSKDVTCYRKPFVIEQIIEAFALLGIKIIKSKRLMAWINGLKFSASLCLNIMNERDLM